ncbi:fructose-1,6-bisphosphatase [Bosea sp. CRIB-10]|nr:fructose-1,6-bisphosphatase [Bosea sp. CRIB-10]
MPRFRKLAEAEVRVKSPGEEVTIADEEAERLLGLRLPELLPGSRVIGEEAVSARPELLQGLGEGTVFVVDPVDGTSNFVKGSPCFSMMVALLREGETVASWMLSPAAGTLHVAERGSGAWVDGERVRVGQSPQWSGLRGGVLTRFLPAEITARVKANSRDLAAILPGMFCAGEEYPAIVRGEQHFVMFWRGLPWDHAPGTLFLEERRRPGRAFRRAPLQTGRAGLRHPGGANAGALGRTAAAAVRGGLRPTDERKRLAGFHREGLQGTPSEGGAGFRRRRSRRLRAECRCRCVEAAPLATARTPRAVLFSCSRRLVTSGRTGRASPIDENPSVVEGAGPDRKSGSHLCGAGLLQARKALSPRNTALPPGLMMPREAPSVRAGRGQAYARFRGRGLIGELSPLARPSCSPLWRASTP